MAPCGRCGRARTGRRRQSSPETRPDRRRRDSRLRDFRKHHFVPELRSVVSTEGSTDAALRGRRLADNHCCVKERAEEAWADTEQALRKVLETDLKMPADHVKAIAIERAHRTGGAQNADRDRTVVVKFTNFKERDSVLQAARANRPRGVFVNEDFSRRVVSRRKELIPEMKEARDRGKIAYLSYDRLVIKDRQERHQR